MTTEDPMKRACEKFKVGELYELPFCVPPGYEQKQRPQFRFIRVLNNLLQFEAVPGGWSVTLSAQQLYNEKRAPFRSDSSCSEDEIARIARMRKELGISQKTAGHVLHVGRGIVSMKELGTRPLLKSEYAKLMAYYDRESRNRGMEQEGKWCKTMKLS